VVNFGTKIELPADFATLLIAGDNAHASLGQLLRINKFTAREVCGYRYSDARRDHSFFFSHQPGPWALETWASDASFLYWSFDRETEEHALILCGGAYADAGRRRVLSCSKRVNYAEALSSATKVELFSSDPGNVTLQMPLDRVMAEGHLTVPGDNSNRMGT
jgi:hypothetical protein